MLNIWNNFALTSGDVGEAYSRCASVMKNSNISMEDSIGLIIGAQESKFMLVYIVYTDAIYNVLRKIG